MRGFPHCILNNFNPRSREGSDGELPHLQVRKLISIHAPVKGATAVKDIVSQTTDISIHAPVKGATSYHVLDHPSKEFQSTLP